MDVVTIAGIEILVDEREKYVQVSDAGHESVRTLTEYLDTQYADYDVCFCYHDTTAPAELLCETGARLISDCARMMLYTDPAKSSSIYSIALLTETEFPIFAEYHDRCNPDMYWTSKRIQESLSEWCIFVIWDNDGIAEYILLSMWDSAQAEVYCIHAVDIDKCLALLSAAAVHAFNSDKTEVLFMADKGSVGFDAALAAGFSITGQYQEYMRKANSL